VRFKRILPIVILVVAMISVTLVNAKLRTTYVEDPIRGIVYWPGNVDTYECGEPHTIKVVITDCDYSVHVKVKQSGAVLFDDTLSEGENTGWLDADEEETWVEIDHPDGMAPPAIYYEGKICMWVS
jgi:hypothetical protein